MDKTTWSLREINFPQLDILDDWKSFDSRVVAKGFISSKWKMSRALKKFEEMDRQIGSKRHVYVARRLLALRRALHEVSAYLSKAGYDSSRSWRISNCRPAGGKWVCARGTTFYQCRSLICPWCWLRRAAMLRRKALAAPGVEVATHLGSKTPGVGLIEPVQVTSFAFSAAEVLKNSVLRTSSYHQVEGLVNRRLEKKRDESVYTVSDEPEFDVALRLVGIMPSPDKSEALLTFSYLHNGVTPVLGRGCKIQGLCGELVMTRHDAMSIRDALRRFQPYPIWLLNWVSTRLKELLETTSGLRMYGVRTLRGER